MSKKRSTVAAACLVLGVVVLGLAVAVYAKYISTITKSSTATVAKWAFTTDNTAGSVTCDPGQTYDPDTLVENKIAPGTSGSCPISVSNETSEVGVHYDIKPSTITNQPTNLKFYTDAAHQNEITGNVTVNGTLKPGDTATTAYVYWYWPYETGTVTDGIATGDAADTTDGVAGGTMTITFDVTGTQVQPAAQ